MSITVIQIFLIVAIFIMLIFIRSSNLRSFYRLFIMGALLAGVIAVIKPDITSKVASFFGVGRGTDLVFYIFIVVVFLKLLTTDDTINAQHDQITKLVRKNAIDNAKKLDNRQPLHGNKKTDQY